MRKVTLFILIVLLFAVEATRGQQPKGLSAGQFNAGVLARVAEMTATAQLTPDRQVLLARYYVRRDSLVLKESSSADPKKLLALIADLDKELSALLTAGERIRYSTHLYGPYFQWEAKEMALYLSNRYQTRPEIQQWFHNIVLNKNLAIVRSFATTPKEIDPAITRLNLQKYDSMMAVYTIAAKGEDYLKRKLASIDSIKPLEEQKRRRVTDNFMSVCLNKGDNYAMNFRTALQLTSNDSIYYTHLLKDSTDRSISIESKEELEMLSYKYWLPNPLLKEIEPIVMGKKRQAIAIELRYPYGRVRDSLLHENAEMAWAKMKHKMIRAGHYRLANNRFVYTMAYKKVLKLSEGQLDSLAYKNYQLDLQAYQYNLIDPWNKYEGEAYVKFHLERILTSGQYDTLLRLESNPRAMINAKKNWEEIRKAGLASSTDSALVCNQLFGYHLAYTSITRRYSGNSELQRRLQQQASERKPAVLKRLEATMKLNEYETNTVNTSQ